MSSDASHLNIFFVPPGHFRASTGAVPSAKETKPVSVQGGIQSHRNTETSINLNCPSTYRGVAARFNVKDLRTRIRPR